MSSSDDYIPNAEDNLSILSEMDRSSAKSEIDLEEINDVLLKNIESDVFNMQNEVKQKDFEMKKLLEEIQKQYFAEKDQELQQAIEEYEEKLGLLRKKVGDLEENLQEEKEEKEKYMKLAAQLEGDNDKLKEENQRQQERIAALNSQIQKLGTLSTTKSTVSSSGLTNLPDSPIEAQGVPWNKKGGDGEKKKSKFVFDLGGGDSDSEMAGLFKSSSSNEEVWINKLELLREKLVNEQNRNRELEFMTVTQKSIIENSSESMSKLKADNKALESKIEKIREDMEAIGRTKIIDKSRVDSVITFCDLMENCVFPTGELLEKMSEFPSMISSYLKGTSDTISFGGHGQSKLMMAASKIKETLEQIEGNEENKGNKVFKAGLMASELNEIRHGLTNLTQYLSQTLPSKNGKESSLQKKFVATRIEEKPDEEDEEDGLADLVNSYKDKMFNQKPSGNFKSSLYFTNLVQNSNCLLWNFQQTQQNKILKENKL